MRYFYSAESADHAKKFRTIVFLPNQMVLEDICVEKNLSLPTVANTSMAFVIAEKIWWSPNNDYAFDAIGKLTAFVPEGVTLIERLSKFEGDHTKSEQTSFLAQWEGNLPEWFDASVLELHKAFDKSLVDLGYVKVAPAVPVVAPVVPTPNPVVAESPVPGPVFVPLAPEPLVVVPVKPKMSDE